MKYTILKILLTISILLNLMSCKSMNPKYEWYGMVTAAARYPVQLIDCEFICNGEYNITTGEPFPSCVVWGADGGVMVVGDKKPVPHGLYVKWLSAFEGQLYEGTFDLPREQLLELFKRGFVSDVRTGALKEGYPYEYLKVGFAPGGVVSVWISGFHSQVLIGQFTATKISAEDSLFKPWGNTQAQQCTLLQDDSSEYMLTLPIPYGLWDEYNRRFLWRYNIRLEDKSSSFNTLFTTYSNGEEYFIYTPELMGQYNRRAYPRTISLSWRKDDDVYAANIRFDKPTILDLFQRMSTLAGDSSQIDFCVDISKYNNLLRLSLESGEHKIALPEMATKIMVFIPTQGNKVIFCSNNWSDDTDGIGGDYFNEYYVAKK